MAKGLAVGIDRGFVVSEIKRQAPKSQPTRKRVKVIRRVIAEISGRSPYERKIIELLKQSKANSQKKAYKLAKKSLGTHKRAQKKKAALADVVSGGR